MEDPGVPLAHYLDDHKGVDVLLNCNGCMAHRVLPMAGVLKRLAELGREPRKVGIREIAAYMTTPCERCGKTMWETRPHWPIGRGQGQRVD
jgi:hypothetical protein